MTEKQLMILQALGKPDPDDMPSGKVNRRAIRAALQQVGEQRQQIERLRAEQEVMLQMLVRSQVEQFVDHKRCRWATRTVYYGPNNERFEGKEDAIAAYLREILKRLDARGDER